ncbi:hypothetical protein QL285_000129 [Trifolium repens]|nr:hypothetical protein QL285_000129 [Trifolium repens]
MGKYCFFYSEFWIKGKKNSNGKLSVKRKRLENWEELKKNREREEITVVLGGGCIMVGGCSVEKIIGKLKKMKFLSSLTIIFSINRWINPMAKKCTGEGNTGEDPDVDRLICICNRGFLWRPSQLKF